MTGGGFRKTGFRRLLRTAPMVLCAVMLSSAAMATELARSWPDRTGIAEIEVQPVRFASHSPFTLAEVGDDPVNDPPTEAIGRLYLPAGSAASASGEAPAHDERVPGVILLHGAAGVLSERELTYAEQFAAMGVAALVIDVFAARPDHGGGFVERLLNVTETMFLADAYAGLAFLAARPEIDPDRIALIGFSYGGMVATYAAYDQVARTLAPGGPRFAAHVAFYAPCIAHFEQNRTTGAPVLMLYGTRDAIVDPTRCSAVADELRAGGSRVSLIEYEGAYHQWDGHFAGPRRIGRNIADCALTVDDSGQVWDDYTWMVMSGPVTRKTILWMCVGAEGYLIGKDDTVRARSNQDLGRFLEQVFRRG